MLDELWVEEGEPGKLILVKVHHEELVRGCQLRALTCELSVKIGHIFPVTLTSKNYKSSEATNSGLAKLNPANSLPLRLERM